MADVADLAEQREAAERALGLQRVRARVAAEGTAECVECGIEIPSARRAAYPAARTCVDCQAALEREQRLMSGGLWRAE